MDFILSAGRVRGADAERNLQQFSSAEAVNQLGAEKTGGGRVYCAHYRRQPEGRKLCGETVDYIIEAEKGALGVLTEKEQEDFMNLFEKYTGQFKLNMREIPERGGTIT